METAMLEPYGTADKWGYLETTANGQIEVKSNYYYPLDPSYYVDLMRRGAKKLTSVEIWPNNYCNQKCSFCNSDLFKLKGSEALPFDVLARLINDLADLGNTSVRFSGGGEPHIYERMAEIIELIAKRGMKSFFITNGSTLSEELIDSLAGYSSLVRFSFNGGNREDYQAAHGRDHFHQTIENMKKIAGRRKEKGRESSLILGATFILTPQNYMRVSDAVKIVKDCGFNYFLIRPRSPFPTHLAGEAFDIFKDQLVQGRALRAENFYVGGKLRKLDGTKPKGDLCRACYVTYFRAYVTADGNVSTCFDGICNKRNVLGNLLETNFKEIWEGKTHLELRQGLEQGKFFDFCHQHCGNADFNRSIDQIKQAIEIDPDVKFRKMPYDWTKEFMPDDNPWF